MFSFKKVGRRLELRLASLKLWTQRERSAASAQREPDQIDHLHRTACNRGGLGEELSSWFRPVGPGSDTSGNAAPWLRIPRPARGSSLPRRSFVGVGTAGASPCRPQTHEPLFGFAVLQQDDFEAVRDVQQPQRQRHATELERQVPPITGATPVPVARTASTSAVTSFRGLLRNIGNLSPISSA